MLLLEPLGRKGVGAWEQFQFTAWVANSQYSPLGAGTTVTTPTPQPTRSPHPPAAKGSLLTWLQAPVPLRDEWNRGDTPPPRPFALQLVREQRLASPLPHPRGPRLLAPSPLLLVVNCLKDKCSHPHGSSLHPKNLPFRLPTLVRHLNDCQHARPARAPSHLDPGTFQGGSTVPLGLVRGEDVIRGVTPPGN